MMKDNSLRFSSLLHAALSVTCCLAVSCQKPVHQPRLEEIKAVWSKLPIYPGMIEVEGGSTASGFDKAYLSKHFKSRAEYREVKRFYEEHLTKDGWQLSKERELKTFGGEMSGEMEVEFRRGEYELAIDYAPDRLNYGWNYGISVGWFLKVQWK